MESVLLVGSAGVGKSQLARALQCSAYVPDTPQQTYKLQLDTKYYTADVLLRIVDTQHQLSSPLEAVLLTFAANDERSFGNIRKWAERYDIEDIEVKLVVATKADLLQQGSGISRPQWLEDAMSWCLENGFEYIETAAAHPSIDRSLQLDGDQQGVHRVLAALQAHVWPGMVEKQWRPAAAVHDEPQNTLASSSNSSSAVNGLRARAEFPQQTTPQLHQQEDRQPAPQQQQAAQRAIALSSPGQQQQPDDQQSAPQQQQQSAPRNTALSSPGQQQQQLQYLSSAADGADTDQESFLEDMDIDDFEKLMKQAQGMRARLSGLSDDARRAAAADMASKLAAMMGLDGDSEEGSDSELLQ